jgi:hypothetical protein
MSTEEQAALTSYVPPLRLAKVLRELKQFGYTLWITSVGVCRQLERDPEYRIEGCFRHVGTRYWTGERWTAHPPSARRYPTQAAAETECATLLALLALGEEEL